MAQLKVGIMGYGVVGKRIRQVIDSHPLLKATTVSDIQFGKNGVFDDGVAYFSDFHDLAQADVDVVFITLPTYLKKEATLLALEKGKHVFCEASPARTVEEMEEIVEAEKKYPALKLKYSFNYRYHPSVKRALALIQSGELGEVMHISGVCGKSHLIQYDEGWRAKKKEAGGGILLEQGIHFIDIIKQLLGKCQDVQSMFSNAYWKHDVEEDAHVLLKNDEGKIASLHVSSTRWRSQFFLDIVLSQGYVVLSGNLTNSNDYRNEKLRIGKRHETNTGMPKEEVIHYFENNSLHDEIAEFVDCIQDSKHVRGSAQEALEIMKLIQKTYAEEKVMEERT